MPRSHEGTKNMIRKRDAKLSEREEEVGRLIVDAACAVHKELGPGLFETVYEVLLAHELESSSKVHKKQVLTCLRLPNMKLGYLLNFGEALMKDGISRLLNGYITE